jgi:hypothetical protein
LIEQELPVEGAVTSIQEPAEADKVAEPEIIFQLAEAVFALLTVAKMRLVELGITLKPYAG